MERPGLRRSLAAALVLTASLPALANASIVGAAARQQAPPPPSINVARPSVTGTLVARPGGGTIAPILCGDRDVTRAARAIMVNRGLVVCTEEGRLVLVQLSASTRIVDRLWNPFGVGMMVIGDRINAWGALGNNGLLLNPTAVVQDASRQRSLLQTVSGILVARPVAGEGNGGPIVCRDRDVSRAAQALSANRGLVICTAEGSLVLLQLSSGTRIIGSDSTALSVNQLTDGDRIVARGQLRDSGLLLSPTFVVRDMDTQSRATNSQDFISGRDPRLALYVLSSDAGGPVRGIIHALPGGTTSVILCGGRAGTWSSLTRGMTVNINGSIFNRRTMTYVDTDVVTVVSCS